MNKDHLLDPSSYIHQAALEQVTKLWPFTVQLVTVYPRLANEMRAALRMPVRDSHEASDDDAGADTPSASLPALAAPVAPPQKPAAKLSAVDSVLLAMQERDLSIGAFLRLLFARPATSQRSRTHISMLNAFLQARCKDRAEHIVDLIYTHPESAPRPTRGLSRAALNPKDGTDWARSRIFDWASQVVVDAVHAEVGSLVDPNTSKLRPPKHFTWDSLHATRDGYFLSAVRESSPLLLRILLAACMSSSTERESTLPGTEGRGKKQRQPEMVAVSAALMLAATRAPHLARAICTHYGGKVAGDPSTFKHINVLLKRRVKDEDRPDFYPALKLLSESLKADVLDCWMLELETESLVDYFDTHYLSYEELECYAYRIVDQYFSLGAAESAEIGTGTPLTKFKLGDPWRTHTEPRVAQPATMVGPPADDPMDISPDDEAAEPSTTIPADFRGDQTLANGIRRRNDSMLQYEFQFAISDGDFGRAWEVMLAWISRFAGSGHPKYVDELLELFCNFNYEFPAPLTKAIWDNSLGSLTGNPGSYVPLDLLQEWMIGEIKSHMSRSDEAFDSSFVRKVVTPNIRGAQELKKTVRQLFGLAKPSIHRDDGLDDASVARLLRDARSTQANRFRQGRHYGHVARDDDAKGQEELEKGKVQAFLRRTTADAQTCLTSADIDEQEAEPSSTDNTPPADLSMLVDGVFRATSYDDADVWDGFEDTDK